MKILLAILFAACCVTGALAASLPLIFIIHGSAGSGIQSPGPSQALFNAPYYTCNTNYYVSTTGNDSNNGTASDNAHAWLTLAHAASTVTSGVGSGSWCINVLPGTYASGAVVTKGGTTASSTGYIVWRCTTMDGCIITDNNSGGGNGALRVNGNTSSNPLVGYLWFDGFTMTASSASQFGSGMGQQSTGAVDTFCCHHIWYTNNVISGYGESGIQSVESDFVYVVHNHFFNNSFASNCGSQGSGYSQTIPWPIPGSYTLTADDKSNSVVGNMAAPNSSNQYFQQVVMWNIANNNYINNGCTNTDGNGIIFDTFGGIDGGSLVYAHQGLIAFNLTYNNGGAGIKLTNQDNAPGTAGVGVVIANNTSYNDALNSSQCAYVEAGNGTNGENANLWINNIIYYVRGVNCDANGSALGGSTSTIWNNNVADCPNGGNTCTTNSTGTNNPMFHGADWLPQNKSATAPSWVSVGGVGGGSAGSVSSPPSSTNFALQGGSPAIGYGLTKSYLPATSVDAGACSSTLSTCP